MGLLSKLNKKLKNSLNTNVDFVVGKLKKLMVASDIDEIRLLPSLEEDDRVCFTSSDNLRFKSGSEFFRFTRFALLNGEVFFKTQHVTLETIDDETEDWYPMQELEAGLKSGEIDPEFFELYDLWLWIEKNPATWSEIPEYKWKTNVTLFSKKLKQFMSDRDIDEIRLVPTLEDDDTLCPTCSCNLRFKSDDKIFRITRLALLNGRIFFKTQHVASENIEDEVEEWRPVQELEEGLKNQMIDSDSFDLYNLWLWIKENGDIWSKIPEYVNKHKKRIQQILSRIEEAKHETAHLEYELRLLNEYIKNNAVTKQEILHNIDSLGVDQLRKIVFKKKSKVDDLNDKQRLINDCSREIGLCKQQIAQQKDKGNRYKDELEHMTDDSASFRALLLLIYQVDKGILPAEISKKILSLV